MLRLTICDVSRRKVTGLSSAMGLAMIRDPDDWIKQQETFFSAYCAVASKINVVAAWREVGTMMLHFAKKNIGFAGHETGGGWLFTVTRKGEEFGFKPTKPGEARHFSLKLPFTGG